MEDIVRDELINNNTKNDYSFWNRFISELKKNKPALLVLIILGLIIILTILAPLSSYNPDTVGVGAVLETPSFNHWLGTDEFGRDVFTRILYGGRISLAVGFFTMLMCTVLGVFIGVISGYYGGWIDEILMRFTDIFLALPSMLLMIILNVFLTPGITTLVAVLSLFSWPQIARITRAETKSLKKREFVVATKFLGASDLRIFIYHIIPNMVGSISVAASLIVANAILTESTLSFLGLGVQIPQSSWGSMLQGAQTYILSNPTLSFYPGVFIFITVLGFNLLSDVIRSTIESKIS